MDQLHQRRNKLRSGTFSGKPRGEALADLAGEAREGGLAQFIHAGAVVGQRAKGHLGERRDLAVRGAGHARAAISSSAQSIMLSRRSGSTLRVDTGALEVLDDAGGIAHRHHVGRNVPGDQRAGADDAVVPDADTGQYGCAAADPHIVTDRDGPGRLELGAARTRLQRMGGVSSWTLGPIRQSVPMLIGATSRAVRL